MTDCIFCKIVAGEVPCNKIAETENFFAFLDQSPKNPGHTLVIPKLHVKDFMEFPEEHGQEWFTFSKKVVAAIRKGVGVQDFRVTMNNGKDASQLVFHQHTHFIPHPAKDNLGNQTGKKTTSKELAEVLERILSYL